MEGTRKNKKTLGTNQREKRKWKGRKNIHKKKEIEKPIGLMITNKSLTKVIKTKKTSN